MCFLAQSQGLQLCSCWHTELLPWALQQLLSPSSALSNSELCFLHLHMASIPVKFQMAFQDSGCKINLLG